MPDAVKSSPKLRFSSLEALEQAAEVDKKKPQTSDVKQLEKVLPKLDLLLKDARLKGDDETTYIVASRYFDVFRTIHRSKNKNDTAWYSRYTHPKEALQLLESLKESLALRYKANSQTNGFRTPTERGESPVQPNGYTVYQSNSVTTEKKHKDLPAKDTKDPSEITAKDLNKLLKTNEASVLLLDLRSEEEFEKSHITCKNIINLPQDKIEGKLTATMIENMIDTPYKAAWRTRQVFDKVVIMDGGNTRLFESAAVKNLTAVLIEFSSEPIKSRPLLLTGGFYGFNTSFPHLTSDPHYRAPRQENTRLRNLANIRFPTMKLFSDAFGDYPATVSPKPFRPSAQRFEKPTDDFLPDKDGPVYIKDILGDVLPKIQHPNNSRRSPTPELIPQRRSEVITEIPAVDRGLKPRQSNPSVPSDTSLSSNKSDNGHDAFMASNHSNNGYDEVVNSSYVNHTRGSDEDLGDFSSYDDGRSQTLPTVKRSASTMPSVSRNSKPESTQSNSRNFPTSSEESSSRPASMDKLHERSINEQGNLEVRNVDAKSSTLPPGGKLSKVAKDEFFDPSVKVRNIPIIMENSPDVSKAPAQPPQPQRALKPLDTNRRVSFTLPDYPSPSQWYPCLEKPTEPGRTGLANLGNTCYMSGVLQCLSHTKLIRSFYLRNAQGEKMYRQKVNPNNNRGTKGLISVYMDLLMELLWSGRYRWISPVFMKDALTHYKREDFYGREQQDAFSALSAILGLLHQDTNQAKMVGASSQERRLALAEMEDSDQQSTTVLVNDAQKKHKLITDSYIDRLLMFLKENVVECQNCGYQSRTFTCDQMLNLWFPPVQDGYRPPDRSELSDLLNAEMCPSEPIEYKCKKCQRTGNAVQRHYFHSDPDILIVQFKRFGDSSSADEDDRFHKDTRFVNFSHSLSLAKFYKNPTGRKSEYKLYAVLDHFGTLSSGHYIANCLHSDTGKWLKFDDQTVTELSGSTPRDLISQHAYILFYERLS
ncbi:hypothetical protein RvY_04882 [Ramazzottius varieornatus]|uniref:ubiquitinyl hydrolase 1 n=1 Tax=Ramazzottius varieornatus TaxID=947166 RepID=A0A1D1UT46_RAMVA|nr:hypothetical protein RvY_04882 [Ramazzottius varieornatus]